MDVTRFSLQGVALVLGMAGALGGCATEPPTVDRIPIQPKQPALRLAHPKAPVSPKPFPKSEVRAHFLHHSWALQQRTDAALVQGCVSLSQEALSRRPARSWVYAGHGTYRPAAPLPIPAPQCWGELEQVFLSQARYASSRFSGLNLEKALYQPNPVVLYDLTAARWAAHCYRVVVNVSGLENCLSPAELQPIAQAKSRALFFLRNN